MTEPFETDPRVCAVLTPAQMRDADRHAARRLGGTLPLMEAAGRAVAQAVRERWAPRQTVVLCGPGNNGGDGFVAAALHSNAAASARVMLFCGRNVSSG